MASYREQIEPVVRELWKFNEKVEFKTTSEIIALFAKKSPKYVALMKVVLPDGGDVADYTFGLGVPALMLTRTDGDSKVSKKGELRVRNHDFQAYLIVSPDSTGAERYSPATMKATLTLVQDFLQWNTKNKKSQDFMRYTREMAEKNCELLATRTLLVDQADRYKGCTPEEAHSSYAHQLELVDRAQLESTYLGGDNSKAVLFSLPVGTIKSAVIVVELTRLVYAKLILDPATGQIISAYVPGIGKSIQEGLMKMDFKSFSKCE